jgi:type II secretory pathway component PulK
MKVASEKGFALITCLLVSLIIITVAISFSVRVKQRLNLAQRVEDRVMAEMMAWSACQELIFVLSTNLFSPDGLQLVPSTEKPQSFRPGAQKEGLFINFYGEDVQWNEDVTIRVRDTSGMISLIAGDPSLLSKLVQSETSSPENANKVVDGLLDWEDEDDFKHLNGAEKWQYKVKNAGYEPRNFFCQTVDELALVQGMEPNLFARIRPHLNYCGTGNFNYLTASAELLRALFSPNDDLTNRILDLRKKQLLSADLFREVTAMSRTEEVILFPSSRLEITVNAKHGEAASHLNVIYNRRETRRNPYQVELWNG